MRNRDFRLDLMRAVGMLSVILAHCFPPFWLVQLRNFDVPLMVMVSGASFGLSYGRKEEGYGTYLKKRVLRLLTPMWGFLTIYFGLVLVLFTVLHRPFPYSKGEILFTYLLRGGIGFIWIIRVFALVAVFSPLIFRLNKNIRSNRTYLTYLVLGFLLNEAVVMGLTKLAPKWAGRLEPILEVLPYCLIFALGLRLNQLTTRGRWACATFAMAVFVIIAVFFKLKTGIFTPAEILNPPTLCTSSFCFELTQSAKYPPTLYYSSYAVGVSIFIYLLFSTFRLPKAFEGPALFLSVNSMWLYLWHIPFIEAYRLGLLPTIKNAGFLAEWLVALTGASLMVMVHGVIVRSMNLKKVSPKVKTA